MTALDGVAVSERDITKVIGTGTWLFAHKCKEKHPCNCAGVEPGHRCNAKNLVSVENHMAHEYRPLHTETIPDRVLMLAALGNDWEHATHDQSRIVI